jgi:hypothetical protein
MDIARACVARVARAWTATHDHGRPLPASRDRRYAVDVSVSERERRHFVAIAEAKREERRERIREALAKPAVQRIIEGLELGEAMPTSSEREVLLDRRALAQAELQARARRLGLR